MTRQTLQTSLRKTFWDVRAQYSSFTTFCNAHNKSRCTERNAIREPSWCWVLRGRPQTSSDVRQTPTAGPHTDHFRSGLVLGYDGSFNSNSKIPESGCRQLGGKTYSPVSVVPTWLHLLVKVGFPNVFSTSRTCKLIKIPQLDYKCVTFFEKVSTTDSSVPNTWLGHFLQTTTTLTGWGNGINIQLANEPDDYETEVYASG